MITAKLIGRPANEVQIADVYHALMEWLVDMTDQMKHGHPAPILKSGSLEWTTSMGELLSHYHRAAELKSSADGPIH